MDIPETENGGHGSWCKPLQLALGLVMNGIVRFLSKFAPLSCSFHD